MSPTREEIVAARRAAQYRLEYPEALPITGAREEILAALAAHRVIVVCGDTGSGKTTQLPKLCLEAGRGIAGMIGHTQPRRIAAQAVASRLAAELGVRVGDAVGLAVRFTDQTSPTTLVKVMTDGILLNEIGNDRQLRRYDTLIVDEAHERSLNIDFVLGYLRLLESVRPDLKIVITSATIDPERFAAHFGGAPIIRVPGRSFPVTVRYSPRADDQDLASAVVTATRELAAEPGDLGNLRDMLVFLPGERWIRDAEHALARFGPKGYETLPLYARLTTARQRRILEPGRAPRIVLATNVAETSLTVPRIRYVVDSGLARVSRYGTRHRVQSLGVEPIAQANAIQRAGRCGRLAPGICVRLYAEEDFDARPAFTEPEILRMGLAGVLLRLTALKLGPIDEFPFIDAPPAKAVADAYQLLHLLGAIDEERRLTRDGELMARLPVDPRLARLLVVANRNGALREGLVIAAALSVVDPREYGVDPDAARRKHEVFAEPRSEFMSYLNLWRAYRHERRNGERALRNWCKEHYLAAARLREWHDVHDQLHELVQSLGWRTRHDDADYRAIHQAVLAAFIDFMAEHEDGLVYRGMRESRAQLFAGTALAKKRPRWLVAAERVATERQYLRTVAQVNPRWALRVAPHLVRFEHDDPHWDRERGQVTAREVVTLFGLTLASERRIDYGRVRPQEARRMFVTEALAADDAGFEGASEPDFLAHNRALRAAVQEAEARLRKRDLNIGEAGVAAFYDERLPAAIHDRESLAAWCAAGHGAALAMTLGDVASRAPGDLVAAGYASELAVAGQRLPLAYAYAPGDDADGLTVTVPRPLLGAVRAHELDRLVPAWLLDKVVALLRALPKEQRRALVPLPNTAAAALAAMGPRSGEQPLAIALAEALRAARGVDLAPAVFDEHALPVHLRMRIAVAEADGTVRATGRDLKHLQRELGAHGASPVVAGTERWRRTGLARWDVGDLPDTVVVEQRPRDLTLCPCLADVAGRVDLTLLPPGPAAAAVHRAGVRRLLTKTLPQQTTLIRERILRDRALVLAYHGVADGAALVDDVLCASVEEAFTLDPPIRTATAFAECLERGRAGIVAAADELRAFLQTLLPVYRELRRALDAAAKHDAHAAVRAEIEAQLAELVGPRMLTATPPEWRRHLPRYFAAALQRWQKRGQRAEAERAAQVRAAAARLAHWLDTRPEGDPWPPAIVEYRWLLEELRVSLFAQQLGTVRSVSPKRLEQAWRQALASA